MVFASIAIFFASTSRNKKFALRSCEQRKKFGEHEQTSTRLNFASKPSKGKILRAVKNFNGPFITPPVQSNDPEIDCNSVQPLFNLLHYIHVFVGDKTDIYVNYPLGLLATFHIGHLL